MMIAELLSALQEVQQRLDVQIARVVAAEAHAATLKSDLDYWQEKEKYARERENALRKRLFKLEAELQQLRHKIELLAREKLQALVEQVFAILASAMESSEAVMPGRVISLLEAEIRGIMGLSQKGIGLQFLGAEAALGHAISTVRMGIRSVPASLPSQMLPAVAQALEQLQSILSDWQLKAGADIAQQLVASLTRLLADRESWTAEGIGKQLEELVSELQGLVTALPEGVDRNRLNAAVSNLAEKLTGRARPTPTGSDLGDIASALQRVATAVRMLSG
jgi:hypothetical protein